MPVMWSCLKKVEEPPGASAIGGGCLIPFLAMDNLVCNSWRRGPTWRENSIVYRQIFHRSAADVVVAEGWTAVVLEADGHVLESG